MTLYLLDTDSFIFLLKSNVGLQAKVQQIGPSAISLSVITVAEALHGAFYANNPVSELQLTRGLLNQFRVIDVNQAIAEKCGQIRATLWQSGQRLEDFDLLIGSTAIVEQRTLVTNNLKHFNRLSAFGLVVENWKS